MGAGGRGDGCARIGRHHRPRWVARIRGAMANDRHDVQVLGDTQTSPSGIATQCPGEASVPDVATLALAHDTRWVSGLMSVARKRGRCRGARRVRGLSGNPPRRM
jgi:hypothetical protein